MKIDKKRFLPSFRVAWSTCLNRVRISIGFFDVLLADDAYAILPKSLPAFSSKQTEKETQNERKRKRKYWTRKMYMNEPNNLNFKRISALFNFMCTVISRDV